LKEGEFINKVTKGEFAKLESEMKEITIGDKIERLEIK